MMVVPLDADLRGHPRPVRHRARVDPARLLRPGSRPVGGRRHLQLVRQRASSPAEQGHEELTEGAAKLRPGESGLLALDWHNGNRTILVDPRLTGGVIGLTLQTTPAELYRAWIEATAFGARVIMERFEEYGQNVEQIINCGGISVKNPLVMQIYADIMGRPARDLPQRADGRARLRHRRGRGGRGVSVVRRSDGSHDGPAPARLPAGPGQSSASTTGCTRCTAASTTPSACRGRQDDLSDVMKELLTIRDEVRHV